MLILTLNRPDLASLSTVRIFMIVRWKILLLVVVIDSACVDASKSEN